MLKKTITYTDFNDQQVTKDFYFHLSRADIAEFGLTKGEGFEKKIQEIIEAKDGAEIIRLFKEILEVSYGVKSEDGQRFMKSQDLWLSFLQSPAYSELFMELVTDANRAAEFIRGIVPSDVAKNIDNVELPQTAQETQPEQPAWVRERREPTEAELRSMSKEQLQQVYLERASRTSA